MPKLLLPTILCVCAWVPASAQLPTGMEETQPFAKILQFKLLPTTGNLLPVNPAGHRLAATPSLLPVGPVSLLGPVTIKVFNGYAGRDLSNVILEWEVLVNGMGRQKGKIPALMIAAKHSAPVHLPVRVNIGTNDEVLLNIAYKTKKAEAAILSGFLLAKEQLPVKGGYANDMVVRPDGELTFKDESGFFTISSPGMSVNLNKQTGWLQHYEVKGTVLLEDNDTLGLRADFWGEPAGNDSSANQAIRIWQLATKNPRLQLFSTSTGTNFAIVNADYDLPGTFCSLHVRYSINSKGEMLVEQRMDTDTTHTDSTNTQPKLPRFGMQWFLSPGFDSVSYYGKGPDEDPESVKVNPTANHPPLGIYKQAVELAGSNPNVPSRERAPQTSVRWWKITDRQGKGIMILGDSALLTMNATPYFNGETEPHAQTRLTIEYPHTGGEGLLPYRSYRYAYKIVPVVP
ncbi:beta-galactosidase small subunit-related protein [Flavitalea flava]